MSRGERKAMVRRDIPGLSLSRQCQVLSISRSSFYYTPKGESAENLALMRRIDELFLKYPFYGSRQMVRQLQREGIRIGRHRVRRLTDGFKTERVIAEWIDFYNTERPHSSFDGRTPAEAYGIGQPMDMMDKAPALPTSPQAQQQKQNMINRIQTA